MRVLGARVALKITDKQEAKTASGIHLVAEQTRQPLERGTVVHAGELASLKPGEQVIFKRYGADEADVQGEHLAFVDETEVVAVIDN